jgi:hypothetical protein
MNAVDIYAPWADHGEKALRARLYRSRDICGAHAARTTGWTHHIWKTAEDMAADTVWRRCTLDELRAFADAVARMIQSARRLEDGGVS